MNKSRKYITFLITAVLWITFSSLADAAEWERVVNLKGKWKFSIGDDKKWAGTDYKDNDWEEINVPSSWENEGFYGYNGYAWYRKYFKLVPEQKNKSLYLQLGYVDDVDEVYINGKLIGFSGSFPPDYETAYNAFRTYPIPAKYLNFNGYNLVAVRVYDSQLEGGIMSGDIGIYSQGNNMNVDINLEGEWKFRLDDDPSWKEKNFNDNDWKTIFVPGYWEAQGYKDYNGFAWYRINFKLPSKLKDKKLVLVMGKIDDIDEVYINGKMVGNTGQIKSNIDEIYFDQEWQQFRGYYIPAGLLNPNQENTIAVRVYDGFINGGIYQGPIGIITQDKYIRFWKEKKREKNIFEIIFGEE